MEIWLYNQYTDQRDVLKVRDDDVSIGREEDNDVVLRSPFASRRHARIFKENGSYYIECMGMNGLVAANREVANDARTKLEFGDEVRIGEFSLYMMEPSTRRVRTAREQASPRQRVIGLERDVHAELLERLNLRVTGKVGSADEKLVGMIKKNLKEIIDARSDRIDEAMSEHLIEEFLWRQVLTEITRRATGKLLYSYGFESTDLLEPKNEEALSRIIGDIISAVPLRLRPQSLKYDAAKVEENWSEQLEKHKARISPELRDYVCRRMISKEIEDVVLGYGPLQDLLEMPNVSEIMVVGKDKIYIEKDGVVQNTGRSFFSDEIVESVIERIITPIGRRIDRSQPLVDARLPDGSRVNAVITPLSLSGPALTIRKFARIPFSIDDLVERGTLTERTARFLQACVVGRKNLMISGGTGSGKTTTLNVLSNFIPASERIVTIEDSAELQLQQDHLVRMETRPANIEGRGAYTIRDLVRNALRMRPDRLIVGEVRGPEALDMLQAMNTGHDGSLSTIHANNPQDTMLRLETMVMMAVEMPVRAIRDQVVAALDLVVQIARMADGTRRVTHISEVVGLDPEDDTVILEDIYRARLVHGVDASRAELRHTGYVPAFCQDLVDDGILSVEVFT